MIAYLTGRILSFTADTLILDVGGVGYLVHIPMGTSGRLKPDDEGRVSLHVHTSVREDAITLFGFHSTEVKALYTKLISVNGVGPKLALSVLSELSPAEIVRAVLSNDVKEFTRVSGVGKKTAQRLILELKTSLDDIALDEISPAQSRTLGPYDDLRSALLNLGYNPAMVDVTVEKMAQSPPASLEVESLLREALKMLR
ncbi:MAG: Holliday junction branch migration protein RuvA [Bradymonadaceae bacterium]